MVILFSPDHMDLMSLAPEEGAKVRAYAQQLATLAGDGWLRTIVNAEGPVEVLGVAGVAPAGADVGEVFVVMAEGLGARRIEFVKGVRQLLEQARGRFARIQALGAEGDARIARWLSWLGFTPGDEVRVVEGKRMVLWRLT